MTKDAIANLIDPKHPASFNYALLDLASQICTKIRPPDCIHCPVLRQCIYGQQQVKDL